MLAAGVEVGVGLAADHRHRLGACGAEADQFGPELLREPSRLGRRSVPRDDDSQRAVVRRRRGRGIGCRVDHAERGQGHGAHHGDAVDGEGDVHGPVGSWRGGELAGAVEWVDDPRPVGGEPPGEGGGVLGRLLGEDRVVGSFPGESVEEVAVGLLIGDCAELVGACTSQFGAEIDQQLARLDGELPSEVVVCCGRLGARGVRVGHRVNLLFVGPATAFAGGEEATGAMGAQDGTGMEVFETRLPGVGTRYEFSTVEGDRLGVVARRDSRRDLVLYDRDDPDTCRAVVELNSEEAAVLVDLLGGSKVTQRLADLRFEVEGLAIEWVTMPAQGGLTGATIGEGAIRSRSGASVVAIVREGASILGPGPEFRFAAGDVVLVMGDAEGVAKAATLLAG